jgi:hypothetical protein
VKSGVKREPGASRKAQIRGCPRNCKRRAAIHFKPLTSGLKPLVGKADLLP